MTGITFAYAIKVVYYISSNTVVTTDH